jgi:type II secretory pathway pseudopilin PulG
MKRFAFTMLELVFVIIVIGILAVLAMPNFNRHPLQEAAEQVANHIRYTQHLAMVDDKFDPNDTRWYLENWQFEFKRFTTPLRIYYEIYSDIDHNGNSDTVSPEETARDPLTHDYLDGSNKNTDIVRKFAIKSVTFSPSCHVNTSSAIGELAFDHLGRPYYYITGDPGGKPLATNMYQYLLKGDCNITLTHPDGTAVITIRPETGYVSVTY